MIVCFGYSNILIQRKFSTWWLFTNTVSKTIPPLFQKSTQSCRRENQSCKAAHLHSMLNKRGSRDAKYEPGICQVVHSTLLLQKKTFKKTVLLCMPITRAEPIWEAEQINEIPSPISASSWYFHFWESE